VSRAWAVLLALLLPITVRADDSPERAQIDLASIPTVPATALTSSVGLVRPSEGAPPPAGWPEYIGFSRCTRGRRASYQRDETGEYGWTSAIVTVGGQDYLEEASVRVDQGALAVDSHTRRPVKLVATLGEVGVWAYREAGALYLGTFADFGEMDRALTSFGCRWRTIRILERGGVAALASMPSMSDPGAFGEESKAPPPTGPSFSIAASLSRSASDAAPLLVVRLRSM
jgi:hypothetical protein